jgi:hypothetical protein
MIIVIEETNITMSRSLSIETGQVFAGRRRAGIRQLLSVAALAVTLSVSAARADNLSLGGPYNSFNFYINNANTSTGGGSIQNSSLNGNVLAFVYCVDLFDDINVSGDYDQTTFDTYGYVNGNPVNNAGEISWLLDHDAVAAETSANAQVALQAAIWHVMYGSNYYLDPLSSADGL